MFRELFPTIQSRLLLFSFIVFGSPVVLGSTVACWENQRPETKGQKAQLCIINVNVWPMSFLFLSVCFAEWIHSAAYRCPLWECQCGNAPAEPGGGGGLYCKSRKTHTHTHKLSVKGSQWAVKWKSVLYWWHSSVGDRLKCSVSTQTVVWTPRRKMLTPAFMSFSLTLLHYNFNPKGNKFLFWSRPSFNWHWCHVR